MRIITAYKQGQCMALMWKIIAALKSDDDIERLDAIGDVAELAYIIGGIKLMDDVGASFFKEEQEHETDRP